MMTGRRMQVWDGEKTQDLWGRVTPFPKHMNVREHKHKLVGTRLQACSMKYPCYSYMRRFLLTKVIPDQINKYQHPEIVVVTGAFPVWTDKGNLKKSKNSEARYILSYAGANSGTGPFKTRQAAINWYRNGGR